MILQDLVRFRKFNLCRGSANKADVVTNSGIALGNFSQWLYLLVGEATLKHEGGLMQITAGMNDLTQFLGQSLQYTVASESASWVAFNPAIRNTELAVLVTQDPKISLTETEHDTYVVPIEGQVIANNKAIPELGCGLLSKGKAVEILVPNGSICALVQVMPVHPK